MQPSPAYAKIAEALAAPLPYAQVVTGLGALDAPTFARVVASGSFPQLASRDSSGVGINASVVLDLQDANGAEVAALYHEAGSGDLQIVNRSSASPIKFIIGSTPKATIDSSGNLAMAGGGSFGSVVQLASVDTSSPGTAVRQCGIDSVTGKLVRWTGSAWVQVG